MATQPQLLQSEDTNLLNAGFNINITKESAINVAIALSVPIVVGVLLLVFYKRIK